MPVVGRKPKPPGEARNRVKPVYEWVEVPAVPYRGPHPTLPATRMVSTAFGPKSYPLQALTRRWWKSVYTMPHCVLWRESDWMFALATAIVADAAFCGGVGAATELRNREKILGVTADARMGLRIRYVDPNAESSAPPQEGVTVLADYRDL